MTPPPSLPYVQAIIEAAISRVRARKIAERTIGGAVRRFDDLNRDPPKR